MRLGEAAEVLARDEVLGEVLDGLGEEKVVARAKGRELRAAVEGDAVDAVAEGARGRRRREQDGECGGAWAGEADRVVSGG